MKKILVTGGTSFIGRNILPLLARYYDITAPKRDELNVVDKQQVDSYLQNKSFDILIHLAAPNPSGNPLDTQEHHFYDITRAFLNLESHAEDFEKIIYTGSGAEYDKTFDICMAREENIGRAIPALKNEYANTYAYAKYIFNVIARNSNNIYNLRLFGCYGPGEGKGKFVSSVIDSCLRNEEFVIHKDCRFDYLYIEDAARVVLWFIEHEPHHHDYNVVSGKPLLLSELARIVMQKMGNSNGIRILGQNTEYTASNARLLREIGDFKLTSISEGIDKQIAWQKEQI